MKFNKKKFFRNMVFLILFVTIIVYGVYLYKTPEARQNIAVYYSSLMENFKEEELKVVEELYSINHDIALQNTILAGKDGILVINKNGISEYSNSKNPIWVKEFNMTNPIVDSEGAHFVVAESKGKKIVAFNNKTQLWEYECKNPIDKVFINSTGYVGVIFSQTGYKNGFLYISPEGKEICSKLFAKTNLIDVDISPNGKMIAMIEADTSTSRVSSAVSIMSSAGEIVYSSIENNLLMSGIRYLDSNNVVCVGDSKLIKIDKNYEKTILDDFAGKKVSGVNLENQGKVITVYREEAALFADKSKIQVTNANQKINGTGEVSGVVKSVESLDKTIAIVLADRIDFFDISGKYLNSITINGKYKSMELFLSGNYACIETTDELNVVRVR